MSSLHLFSSATHWCWTTEWCHSLLSASWEPRLSWDHSSGHFSLFISSLSRLLPSSTMLTSFGFCDTFVELPLAAFSFLTPGYSDAKMDRDHSDHRSLLAYCVSPLAGGFFFYICNTCKSLWTCEYTELPLTNIMHHLSRNFANYIDTAFFYGLCHLLPL